MPPIRYMVSKRHARVVKIIVLLSKIIPSCSRCIKKKLLYIAIIVLSSY